MIRISKLPFKTFTTRPLACKKTRALLCESGDSGEGSENFTLRLAYSCANKKTRSGLPTSRESAITFVKLSLRNVILAKGVKKKLVSLRFNPRIVGSPLTKRLIQVVENWVEVIHSKTL